MNILRTGENFPSDIEDHLEPIRLPAAGNAVNDLSALAVSIDENTGSIGHDDLHWVKMKRANVFWLSVLRGLSRTSRAEMTC